MKIKENKFKLILMSSFLVISIFLMYYFIFILRTIAVFSHFFYIPIILGSIWWGKKGLITPVFLGVLIILFSVITELNVSLIDNILRALFFIIIGIVVASLSEFISKSEYKLKERVKELNCLYGIIKLLENPNITIEEILKGSLYHIKNAWQFPEITCVRISFDNKEYKTANFKETPWNISDKILIKDKKLKIDVHYLENKSFFEEEENLLKEIIGQLKAVFEFRLIWTS